MNNFPFGARPIFGGENVSFREAIPNSPQENPTVDSVTQFCLFQKSKAHGCGSSRSGPRSYGRRSLGVPHGPCFLWDVGDKYFIESLF